MVHKEHIVNFLRINGIPTSASDDEIRDALRYAKWHERDVEYALLTLKSDETGDTTVTASHGVLGGDNRLSPQTIQSLLGIDVNLTRERLIDESYEEVEEVEESRYGASMLVLFSISVFLAFVVLLLLMFIFKIGPYYSPLT